MEWSLKLAVIGTGYVGLVSGACFSEFGFDVTCIDKDADKIARIEDGIMPIYEPGLEDLVDRNVSAGRLRFSVDMGPAVRDADAVFIAVGTPTRRGDGHAGRSDQGSGDRVRRTPDADGRATAGDRIRHDLGLGQHHREGSGPELSLIHI